MTYATIRLGVVGLGEIFTYQSMALNQSEGFKLVCACDTDPAKAGRAGDVPFFSSLDDFLGQDMDAVLVSAPVEAHYDVAAKILAAGKDVLLEKPACPRFRDMEELGRIASSSGRLLHIAVHAAFAPDVLRFIHGLRRREWGDLGPVTAIKSHFYDPYMEDGKVLCQFRGLGGSWMDSGVNGLSVLAQLTDLGAVSYERCDWTTLPGSKVREIQATAHYRFPMHGVDALGWAMIDTNWSLGRNLKFTEAFFHDARESFILHHSRQSIFRRRGAGEPQLVVNAGDGKNRLVNHYLNLLVDYHRQYAAGLSNFQDMLRLHALFTAPYESAEETD